MKNIISLPDQFITTIQITLNLKSHNFLPLQPDACILHSAELSRCHRQQDQSEEKKIQNKAKVWQNAPLTVSYNLMITRYTSLATEKD